MIRFMRRLTLVLLLAGCANPAPSTDGEWFGDMTPEQASPNCLPGRASLLSKRATVLFNPNEGTQTLSGTMMPDGAVAATQSTVGADKKRYVATLAARVEDGSINGTYATPRCHYTVRLRRS